MGDHISLFAAGGLGVSRGFGTPNWRALAGTRIKHVRHDRDRDGLADKVDQCPLVPEDLDNYEDSDGCPDLDNDGDGVADKKDGAPLEAEERPAPRTRPICSSATISQHINGPQRDNDRTMHEFVQPVRTTGEKRVNLRHG